MIRKWISNIVSSGSSDEWVDHTIELTRDELDIFIKALQFYIFTRHKKLGEIPDELAQRLSHAGYVSYSLIITFLEERDFKIDYMQYLNDELKALYQINQEHRTYLDIQPEEIDQIELKDPMRLKFTDNDSGRRYQMKLFIEKGVVNISYTA